jgi:peptide/nickel transport system substrate-binding protein
MKPSGWLWFAVTSIAVCLTATAETRPQYGSTLRSATTIAPQSLDPADRAQPDSIARHNLIRLMFDTLVTMDDRGRLKPSLAISWQSSSGDQRWEFHLHRGAKFHDGSLLTAQAVAASIRAANPGWTVVPGADSITIERDMPDPNVPAQLARARNAITKRSEGGTLIGTGPFHSREWQPGKTLSLAANEDYWNGRPLLNGIEIELGKSARDQMMALELGNLDLAELSPEQTRRVASEGRRVASSLPLVLMVLRFSREPDSSDEATLRRAFGLSIDRSSIRNVLLQSTGEASGGILPDWLSGYGFVFPTAQDLDRARQLRSEVKRTRTWTLAYDASDPLAKLIAERIALNAKDAGISVQVTASSTSDIRLERASLASLNPWVALEAVLPGSGDGSGSLRPTGNSIDDLFKSESAQLAKEQLIPLFYLPVSYALSSTVRNWNQHRDGTIDFEDIWLGGKP